MKSVINYTFLIVTSVLVFACKKDNYKAPSSMLSGKLTYKGEAFGLERNQVPFEIYQYGFGTVGPIRGNDNTTPTAPSEFTSFAQDGTYSALLFDGDYKLIIPNGQGPFMWKRTAAGDPDSLSITMRGNQTLDLEVTPYYMIRTPQITVNSGRAAATFKLEKIITDAVNGKAIEQVTLYVNKTQFASGGDNSGTASIAGSAITDLNNISLSVVIPTFSPTQNYVYARIGLKVAGVEDRMFSPLVRLTY